MVKSKAMTVTGRGCPQGYETSGFPQFLNNQLTDGVRLSALRAVRPPFTLRRKIPDAHCLLEVVSTPRAMLRLEGLGQHS
jgi:hypothetical protein